MSGISGYAMIDDVLNDFFKPVKTVETEDVDVNKLIELIDWTDCDCGFDPDKGEELPCAKKMTDCYPVYRALQKLRGEE